MVFALNRPIVDSGTNMTRDSLVYTSVLYGVTKAII